MAKHKQSLPSFRDILVLDRLITGPIVNLLYWGGLGVILLSGFGVIGGVIGVAIGEGPMGWLLTLPALAFGVLIMVILVAIWRSFCEFYLVVFRISDDLRAIRLVEEDEARRRVRPNP